MPPCAAPPPLLSFCDLWNGVCPWCGGLLRYGDGAAGDGRTVGRGDRPGRGRGAAVAGAGQWRYLVGLALDGLGFVLQIVALRSVPIYAVGRRRPRASR